MNSKKYYLIVLAIMVLAESCVAYNGRDLKFHTECLVDSVLTGEDLDISFVRRHLSIGCDQQDITDTRDEDVGDIIEIFLTNPIISIFREEGCIAKFRELSGIFSEIFRAPASDGERAACILVSKEVSRNLFCTLFDSIKDTASKERLEGERRTFLDKRAPKRLSVAETFEEEKAIVHSPKVHSPPVLSAEVIAQIQAALPYLTTLSSQQLGEMVIYFKGLRINE